MKSKKLVRVFSTIFIALFGIVMFIGGSGVSDARDVSEADFVSHVQCDDSLENAEADVAAEDALTAEAVDCDSQEELSSKEKESVMSRFKRRIRRTRATEPVSTDIPQANGYSWSG